MLFTHRLVGALRLDAHTYEEVEADSRATPQALLIVVLASVATGVGLLHPGVSWPGMIVIQSTGALVGWVAWASLIYLIGVHVLPGPETRSSLGELLRTTGFAAAPALLHAFGAIPRIGLPLFVVSSVWMVVAMLVAVRQALDYTSLWRTIAVCLTGLLLAFIFVAIIGLFFAPSVF